MWEEKDKVNPAMVAEQSKPWGRESGNDFSFPVPLFNENLLNQNYKHLSCFPTTVPSRFKLAGTEPLNEEAVSTLRSPRGLEVKDKMVWIKKAFQIWMTLLNGHFC